MLLGETPIFIGKYIYKDMPSCIHRIIKTGATTLRLASVCGALVDVDWKFNVQSVCHKGSSGRFDILWQIISYYDRNRLWYVLDSDCRKHRQDLLVKGKYEPIKARTFAKFTRFANLFCKITRPLGTNKNTGVLRSKAEEGTLKSDCM